MIWLDLLAICICAFTLIVLYRAGYIFNKSKKGSDSHE